MLSYYILSLNLSYLLEFVLANIEKDDVHISLFKTYRKLKGSQLWVSHNIFFTFLCDNNTYNRSNHDHAKFINIIKTYLGIQFDDKKIKTKNTTQFEKFKCLIEN